MHAARLHRDQDILPAGAQLLESSRIVLFLAGVSRASALQRSQVTSQDASTNHGVWLLIAEAQSMSSNEPVGSGGSVSPARSSVTPGSTVPPPTAPLLTSVVNVGAGIVNFVPLMVNVPAVVFHTRPSRSSSVSVRARSAPTVRRCSPPQARSLMDGMFSEEMFKNMVDLGRVPRLTKWTTVRRRGGRAEETTSSTAKVKITAERAGNARSTAAQRDWLKRGLDQPGGKLPLFDRDGQRVAERTIRSCLARGWAEKWFENPLKRDWLVCRLTHLGRAIAEEEAQALPPAPSSLKR